MRTLGKKEIPSDIEFYDKDTKTSYLNLEKSGEEWLWLRKAIDKAFKNLEKNSQAGKQIPNREISNKVLKKYGIKTLWRYPLPNSWRLLYSPVSDGIKVLSIVLGWGDHKWYTEVINP